MAAKSVTDFSVVPSNKGGYDYEFVSPPPKSLECPVCLLTLRDPHVISCCGNEFCQVCIERVQRDGKPCPLCNEPKFTTFLHKKLVREVNALVVCCSQKELGCKWEGELGQLQSHLNPGVGVVSSNACGFVIVECPLRCGAQFERRLLQEHEMEMCPKQPIQMQVATLMRKFERITIENQQLRQEVEKMQKIHKEELNQVKEELNEVKKENDHLQVVNRDMQKMCGELKQEQNAVKTEVSTQKAVQTLKLNDLEKKFSLFQSHTTPLPMPPFYFSVRNFNHYQSNDLVYRSEPFYSHPGGYKLSVSVDPNYGIDSFGDAQVSISVSILRGEYDDQLRWPFNGRITVQLYNRNTKRWSNEHTVVMNQKECDLKDVDRCVDVLIKGSCPYFLPLSEIRERYLKESIAVRFRVVEVNIF